MSDRRLVWLLMPHSYKKDVRGESNFLVHRDLAEYLASQGDLVYVVVPRWAVLAGTLEKMDRVEWVAADTGVHYWGDIGYLDGPILDLFSRGAGHHPVDVVFTSRFGVIPALRVGMQVDARDPFPIIYWEPGARDKLVMLRHDEAMMRLYCTAVAESTPVYLTKQELADGKPTIQRYMTDADFDSFLDRAVINPVGVRCDQLDQVLAEAGPKNDRLTVFYGARIDALKQTKFVIRAVKRLYRSGRDFDYWVVTPNIPAAIRMYLSRGQPELAQPEEIDDGDRIFVRPQTSRGDYLRAAAKTHIAFYWSKNEGFPVGFWEQAYLGNVLIVPDDGWAKSQFPEGYPFMYDRTDEAAGYAMLADVVDHYEERKVEFDRWLGREFIRTNYDTSVVWARIREIGLAGHEALLARRKKFGTGGERREIIPHVLPDLPDPFTMEEFTALMHKRGVAWPDNPRQRAQHHRESTNWELHAFLLSNGYELVGLRGKHALYGKKEEVDDGGGREGSHDERSPGDGRQRDLRGAGDGDGGDSHLAETEEGRRDPGGASGRDVQHRGRRNEAGAVAQEGARDPKRSRGPRRGGGVQETHGRNPRQRDGGGAGSRGDSDPGRDGSIAQADGQSDDRRHQHGAGDDQGGRNHAGVGRLGRRPQGGAGGRRGRPGPGTRSAAQAPKARPVPGEGEGKAGGRE